MFAIAATHDTIATTMTVIPTSKRIEHMPLEVKIQTHQIAISAVDTILDLIRS